MLRIFFTIICLFFSLGSFALSIGILGPAPLKDKFDSLYVEPRIDHDLELLTDSGLIGEDSGEVARKILTRSHRDPASYFFVSMGASFFLFGMVFALLALAPWLRPRRGGTQPIGTDGTKH